MATALETADATTTPALPALPAQPSTADVLAATLEAARPTAAGRPDKPVPPRPVLWDTSADSAQSFVRIEEQPTARRLRPDERATPRPEPAPKARRGSRGSRGRTIEGPARSKRTTPRARPAKVGTDRSRRTNTIGALLLGAGVVAGTAFGANAAAPGALKLPTAVASALGQPSDATTATTARVTRPAGSVATTATPATASTAAVSSTAATNTGSSVAGTVTTSPSTTVAVDTTAPATTAATVVPPPVPGHGGPVTMLDGAPQPTLPGGQAWPTADRNADGALVVSGVVPSMQAADRLLASLAWYQGPKVNQLTVDPAAASVRYVPVRLTPTALALAVGNGDLTPEEWQVLPLWAKFLVEHPDQRLMVVVNLPTPASPEFAAAASNHLSSVEAEVLATGAAVAQVTSRLVPGGADTEATVEIAVAVDAAS